PHLHLDTLNRPAHGLARSSQGIRKCLRACLTYDPDIKPSGSLYSTLHRKARATERRGTIVGSDHHDEQYDAVDSDNCAIRRPGKLWALCLRSGNCFHSCDFRQSRSRQACCTRRGSTTATCWTIPHNVLTYQVCYGDNRTRRL